MLNFIKNKNSGFTFIELIISISIFMLISGTMFANFRSGDQSNELTKSAEVLASRLREAQTRALSGVGGVGAAGHGVYMENGDTFFLSYKDIGTSALSYDSGEESVTTELQKRTEINVDLDILFAVPSGDLYEAGVLQTAGVTTTIAHTITGLQRDVIISPVSGQVTISDPY